MTDHSIKGIYELRMSSDTRAIIISTASKEDPLKYDYYILSSGSDNGFNIKRIDNPILLARNSKYNIHRISQESDAFRHFADRFASYHAGPDQASRKLHLRENNVPPKLTKRNQFKNRT